MVKNRFISLVTAVMITVTTVLSGAVVSFADSSSVYCKQDGRGYCTLASAVMMMRQKALDEGNPGWKYITQYSTKSTAWIDGQGLRHSFTYGGVSVGYGEFKSGSSVEDTVLLLLDKHPEGIEIYDRNIPHAVFLTRYDYATDTFYVADPVYGYEQPIAESWMRTAYKSTEDPYELQYEIIEGLESYWFISGYTATTIESVDTSMMIGGTTADDSDSSDVTAPTTSADTTADQSSGNSQTPVTVEETPAETTPVTTAPVSTSDTTTGSYYTGSDMGGMSEVLAGLEDTLSGVFGRVNSYSDASFPDVDQSEWYFQYVKEAYELGLMGGQDTGDFDINGNVTIAQCVTMAARIYSTYHGDGHSFAADSTQEWYDPYVDYAENKGIISSRYTRTKIMNQAATRAQFAEIIGGALPSRLLAEVNSVDDDAILDVDISNDAGSMIYKLYRAGIMTGYSDGTFDPDNTITRAQVAAIVVRMADAAKRVVM